MNVLFVVPEIRLDSVPQHIPFWAGILAAIVEQKGGNVAILDLKRKTTIADRMIIASGRSNRHVLAIADHVLEQLAKLGVEKVGIEGREQADWLLLDLGDVIVHLFRPEVREFYNLEKMWAVPLPEQLSR